MRLLLQSVLLFTITGLLFGQEPVRENAEQAVRDAMKVTYAGYYTGSTEKNLERLGDKAAIELIRAFSGRNLNSAEIKSALLIVRMSFSAPRAIAQEADQKPRATLLLLRYLDYQAKDAEMKREISEAQKALEGQRE